MTAMNDALATGGLVLRPNSKVHAAEHRSGQPTSDDINSLMVHELAGK